MKRFAVCWIPVLVLILSVGSIAVWVYMNQTTFWLYPFRSDTETVFAPRAAHVEQTSVLSSNSGDSLFKQITTETGTAAPSPYSGVWPSFRGPTGNSLVENAPPLLDQLPPEGPKRLWEIELGEGYAGAAVYEGALYALDYDQPRKRDVLKCLSLDSGALIWSVGYPSDVKRNHGMSRTIPAVDDRFVVTIGPHCQVLCVDRKTGNPLWIKDLPSELGAVVPQWYAGQCPVLANGAAVVIVGGPDALIIKIDCQTGKILWKSPNPHNWTMPHSSLTALNLDGKRSWTLAGMEGVCCVRDEDGSLIWETTGWKANQAMCPSPVVLYSRDDSQTGSQTGSHNLSDIDLSKSNSKSKTTLAAKLLIAGGYNTGSMIIEIHSSNDPKGSYSVKTEKWGFRKFSSMQQTPVVFKDGWFGTRETRKQMVCFDFDGNPLWDSGRDSFGWGPYLAADGKIFIMDDFGRLTVARLNATRFEPLYSFQAFQDSHDSWGPMALVGSRLIVRDMTRMACFDLGTK